MLFNEPKLLKCAERVTGPLSRQRFSALQRAEIAEISESLLLHRRVTDVSVLFNEPKLLKSASSPFSDNAIRRFSALQRAEIAEMHRAPRGLRRRRSFSALQRAEIAEIGVGDVDDFRQQLVSVLFNEPKLLKLMLRGTGVGQPRVSVLFNEPKLLKLRRNQAGVCGR